VECRFCGYAKVWTFRLGGGKRGNWDEPTIDFGGQVEAGESLGGNANPL